MVEEPENVEEMAPDGRSQEDIAADAFFAEGSAQLQDAPADDPDGTAAPDGPVVPDDLVPDAPRDEEPSRPANPIMAIVVGVLAVALVASAAFFGFKALTGGTSDTHAKIEVAVSFTEAMLSQDTKGLKQYIGTDALKQVTDAQWAALDQSATQTVITFQKVAWSGDTATVQLSAVGQAGEIKAEPDPQAADTVKLTLSGVAFGDPVPGSCLLVREGSSWKVSQFTIGGTTLKFDAANISKTMGAQ